MKFNLDNIEVPKESFEQLQGELFPIDVETILQNKEKVTDFFGDHRNTWYKDLVQFKSPTGGGASLDSWEKYDIDLPVEQQVDLPPLNPEKINDERAKIISLFFKQNEGAQAAFLKYVGVEEGEDQ